ncbi:MAG TPA: pyridoxamine 5'-phosphate oxidase family protein, partial [Alphaproteobacteria bacterium]
MHNWSELVENCLRSTDYLCLATHGPAGVWSSPVYYAWDEEFNLYFMSMAKSRHMQNIDDNHDIALSIYATDQDTSGDVTGLQISGLAKIVEDEAVIKQAFEVYFRRVIDSNSVTYGDKIDSPYAYNPDWIFVKVTPQTIWLFDSKHFGNHRQEVPLADIVKS